MTVKEFFILSDVADTLSIRDQIERLPKPSTVGKVHTPVTLNDLSIGELIKLQSISDARGFVFAPCQILLNIPEDEVYKEEASQVLGFSVWVAKEVERINKLFASTNVPLTSEEKQAGAERLNFGAFGLLDYFALRMGIEDHEDVERIPWVRIYKCLDIDSKRTIYQRKLREILSKKKP